MKPVLQCLIILRASFDSYDEEDNIQNHSRKKWSVPRVDLIEGTDCFRGSVGTYGKSSAIEQENQLNFLDGKFWNDMCGPTIESVFTYF